MHTKRIAAGGAKGIKWVATPKSSHKKGESIPLVSILKDLGYADKSDEARKIVVLGEVMVDGKKRKDKNFGVGLMDAVSIPKIGKNYRVVAEKNGLVLREISETEAKLKPCRVIGKKTQAKGKIQVTLHDGTTFLTGKPMKVNDTVVLELPEKKIKEIIPFAEGNTVFIFSGRHRGKTGTIKGVEEGTAGRRSLTTVGDFKTLTEYLLVIGKDKPVVEL